MTTNLFTVYDSAASAYLEPFYAPTIEYAIRQFRQTVNKAGHQFSQFPEDYTLFHIGEFDMSTGIIKPNDGPVNIGVGITFVQQSPQLEVS